MIPNLALAAAAALALAACSPPPDRPAAKVAAPRGPVIGEATPPAPVPVIEVPPPATPTVVATTSTVGQQVNTAAWKLDGLDATARRDALIRVQVMLDRAHFSPGVIDGRDGGNLKKAIAAYESANGLTADGVLDDAVWGKLTAADAQPVLADYVIGQDDVKGPFAPEIPSDFKGQSQLPALAYRNPLEELAEKFHMDEALLTALNPGADFTQAGTRIVVAATAPGALPEKAAKVEVDKSLRQVRAYDDAGKLLAAYPATVGSGDRPAPTGEWAVRAVALDPNYSYDPSRLTFGDMKAGKMTIAAGPNNPVGSVWIALTKDTYGIHGSPDPRLVGKTASHGCVRLTNWDARQLAAAVAKGVPVVFVGTET